MSTSHLSQTRPNTVRPSTVRPIAARPVEVTAELGEITIPYVGAVGSNLTFEGQLAQTTQTYGAAKGAALSDRRLWVRWTARGLFLVMFGFPIVFVIAALVVALFTS